MDATKEKIDRMMEHSILPLLNEVMEALIEAAGEMDDVDVEVL